MTTQLIALPDLINRYCAHNEIPPDDPRIMPAILQAHAPAGPGFVVPIDALRAEAFVRHDARCHPRGVEYRVPHRLRALAHHWSRPGSVLAEWSALELLGLSEFSAGADVTLLCSANHRVAADAASATVRRRRAHHTTTLLFADERPVLVTERMTTLAACLRALHNKEHAWEIPASLEVDPVTVMSVQLIDRFCRVFQVSHEEVRAGMSKQVSARELGRILALSDPGAESKPETVLRLLAHEAVGDLPGVRLETQVPLYTDGTVGEPGEVDRSRTLLTRFDVAERRLRIGLQHDGEHHLQRSQRDKDAEINADVLKFGWNQIRTSAGMLRRTAETKRRIREAVVAAVRRCDDGSS
ncbi:MAG: hypothetical protein Q4G50_12555 [Corynebacterium sp.]|uniref:hypothetical protein n=1 Tax=Corynebacterium sp. TaxID=1720 RepID=UPI0026E061DA|nr:hypothetical protein [Corynebacterium sp.]MDO5670817.1 hypothetical protein [Corynebacterium sp.]